MKRIQSKKQKLGTYEIDKISLSCFDNKRYMLDDGIYTLSYFHKNSVTSFKKDYYYYYYYYCEIVEKIVVIEKDRNIDEVIRSVLNFLLFFFKIRFDKYKKA